MHVRAASARAAKAALTLCLSLCPCLAGVARADEDDGDREVVVTATRTPTAADEVAVPVVVIERSEIERSLAGDVAALLAGQPGVEVARSGGPGQAASLFLRGSASNHAVVRVDGVRVNPGTIGGAALQNLLPESIERIELVEGARSSLYGSDAIGGVVDITTRAGAARGLAASASLGRYDTRAWAIDGGATLAGVDLGGSLAHQASRGFPPAAGSEARGDYDNTTGNLHLRRALGEGLAAEATGWRSTGHNAYSSFGTPASQDFTDASYSAGLRYAAAGDPSAAGDPGGAAASVFVSRAQAEYRQRESADFDRTVRDAAEAQLTVPHGAHRLAAGVQAASEHTTSLSFGLPYDVRTHSRFAWAQEQWQGARASLLLAAGNAWHDDFGGHWTGNAEGLVRLGAPAGGTLRASVAWGSAFHAPDATSRYGYGGNPALGPETSHQAELGLRWDRGALQLRAGAWENRLAGLVQYVPIDPVDFIYQARNIASARIRGATLQGEWRAAPWRVRAWGELQDARDLQDGSQLLRRARRNGGASAQWERGAGYALAELQCAGPRPDFGGARMGGYALLALGAGWQPTPRLAVQARLENALDHRYELASGYRTPGRSLTLALRYRLR